MKEDGQYELGQRWNINEKEGMAGKVILSLCIHDYSYVFLDLKANIWF